MAWEMPEEGWLRNTLSGKPAFSDGHAMFIGKVKGKTWQRELRGDHPFDDAIKNILQENMPIAKKLRCDFPVSIYSGIKNPEMPCVVLTGDTWIQERYYKHALTFKGVKFYLGKKDTTTQAGHAVICKVGDKIIGAIMPIRTPNTK
jgi:hypothetical protein